MWIPREEKDPVVRHHPTRKSVGYFGAVRLRDGLLVTQREAHNFDAQTFWNFARHLEQISRCPGRRVVVITDNAKFHHARLHLSWRETLSPSFVLDFLPPYSPQLNPIERVWKLLRRLRLHNQYFGQINEVIEAVEAQFTAWCEPNEILRKLCDTYGL